MLLHFYTRTHISKNNQSTDTVAVNRAVTATTCECNAHKIIPVTTINQSKIQVFTKFVVRPFAGRTDGRHSQNYRMSTIAFANAVCNSNYDDDDNVPCKAHACNSFNVSGEKIAQIIRRSHNHTTLHDQHRICIKNPQNICNYEFVRTRAYTHSQFNTE